MCGGIGFRRLNLGVAFCCVIFLVYAVLTVMVWL